MIRVELPSEWEMVSAIKLSGTYGFYLSGDGTWEDEEFIRKSDSDTENLDVIECDDVTPADYETGDATSSYSWEEVNARFMVEINK